MLPNIPSDSPFAVQTKLILELFGKSGVAYEIFKQRVLFECKQVKPLTKPCNGAAFFSLTADLDTVAEMTYRYGVEEWGVREGRDLNHARQLSYQSILQETSCHWVCR